MPYFKLEDSKLMKLKHLLYLDQLTIFYYQLYKICTLAKCKHENLSWKCHTFSYSLKEPNS